MAAHYKYGRQKELQVAEFLERRGFTCARAQASRGAFDLLAERGRMRFVIQVKATRSDIATSGCLNSVALVRLRRSASARGARPTLALVSRNYLWLVLVPDLAILTKGELLPLRYGHPGFT